MAYERDVKRMSLLQKQLQKTGVTNTTTKCQDFLSVDPHDPSFANVEFILVDPSCSGSGNVALQTEVCQIQVLLFIDLPVKSRGVYNK